MKEGNQAQKKIFTPARRKSCTFQAFPPVMLYEGEELYYYEPTVFGLST